MALDILNMVGNDEHIVKGAIVEEDKDIFKDALKSLEAKTNIVRFNRKQVSAAVISQALVYVLPRLLMR